MNNRDNFLSVFLSIKNTFKKLLVFSFVLLIVVPVGVNAASWDTWNADFNNGVGLPYTVTYDKVDGYGQSGNLRTDGKELLFNYDANEFGLTFDYRDGYYFSTRGVNSDCKVDIRSVIRNDFIKTGSYPFPVFNEGDQSAGGYVGLDPDEFVAALESLKVLEDVNAALVDLAVANNSDIVCRISGVRPANNLNSSKKAILDIRDCTADIASSKVVTKADFDNCIDVGSTCTGGDAVCDVQRNLEALTDSIGGLIIGTIAFFMAFLAIFVAMMLQFFLWVLATLGDTFLFMNPASDTYFSISQLLFSFMAQIANILIIAYMVYEGIRFAWGIGAKANFGDFLARLALTALGVQFSFYAVAAVIALSYEIGWIFVQAIDPGLVNPFTAFFDVMVRGITYTNVDGQTNGNAFFSALSSLRETFSSNARVLTGTNDITNNMVSFALRYWVLAAVLGFALMTFLKIIRFLVARVAIMFFLLISAPIGYVLWISGSDIFKTWGNKWFKLLGTYTISFPFIAVMLALGAKVVQEVDVAVSGVARSINQGLASQGNNGLFGGNGLDVVISGMMEFVIPAVMAIGVLMIIDGFVQSELNGMAGQILDQGVKAAKGVYQAPGNMLKGAGQTANFVGKKAIQTGQVAGAGVGLAKGVKQGFKNIRTTMSEAGKEGKTADIRDLFESFGDGVGTKTVEGWQAGENYVKLENPVARVKNRIEQRAKAQAAAGKKQANLDTQYNLREKEEGKAGDIYDAAVAQKHSEETGTMKAAGTQVGDQFRKGFIKKEAVKNKDGTLKKDSEGNTVYKDVKNEALVGMSNNEIQGARNEAIGVKPDSSGMSGKLDLLKKIKLKDGDGNTRNLSELSGLEKDAYDSVLNNMTPALADEIMADEEAFKVFQDTGLQKYLFESNRELFDKIYNKDNLLSALSDSVQIGRNNGDVDGTSLGIQAFQMQQVDEALRTGSMNRNAGSDETLKKVIYNRGKDNLAELQTLDERIQGAIIESAGGKKIFSYKNEDGDEVEETYSERKSRLKLSGEASKLFKSGLRVKSKDGLAFQGEMSGNESGLAENGAIIPKIAAKLADPKNDINGDNVVSKMSGDLGAKLRGEMLGGVYGEENMMKNDIETDSKGNFKLRDKLTKEDLLKSNYMAYFAPGIIEGFEAFSENGVFEGNDEYDKIVDSIALKKGESVGKMTVEQRKEFVKENASEVGSAVMRKKNLRDRAYKAVLDDEVGNDGEAIVKDANDSVNQILNNTNWWTSQQKKAGKTRDRTQDWIDMQKSSTGGSPVGSKGPDTRATSVSAAAVKSDSIDTGLAGSITGLDLYGDGETSSSGSVSPGVPDLGVSSDGEGSGVAYVRNVDPTTPGRYMRKGGGGKKTKPSSSSRGFPNDPNIREQRVGEYGGRPGGEGGVAPVSAAVPPGAPKFTDKFVAPNTKNPIDTSSGEPVVYTKEFNGVSNRYEVKQRKLSEVGVGSKIVNFADEAKTIPQDEFVIDGYNQDTGVMQMRNTKKVLMSGGESVEQVVGVSAPSSAATGVINSMSSAPGGATIQNATINNIQGDANVGAADVQSVQKMNANSVNTGADPVTPDINLDVPQVGLETQSSTDQTGEAATQNTTTNINNAYSSSANQQAIPTPLVPKPQPSVSGVDMSTLTPISAPQVSQVSSPQQQVPQTPDVQVNAETPKQSAQTQSAQGDPMVPKEFDISGAQFNVKNGVQVDNATIQNADLSGVQFTNQPGENITTRTEVVREVGGGDTTVQNITNVDRSDNSQSSNSNVSVQNQNKFEQDIVNNLENEFRSIVERGGRSDAKIRRRAEVATRELIQSDIDSLVSRIAQESNNNNDGSISKALEEQINNIAKKTKQLEKKMNGVAANQVNADFRVGNQMAVVGDVFKSTMGETAANFSTEAAAIKAMEKAGIIV